MPPPKKKKEKAENQVNNFPVSVYVTTKHGKPALELRTLTTNPTAIKIIIERALSDQPVLIFPTFKDKIRASNSLCEKKILKYNSEKRSYKFLI